MGRAFGTEGEKINASGVLMVKTEREIIGKTLT